MNSLLDLEAVKHFKEYLVIPSVQPNCDYSRCVEFLEKMATGLKLPLMVHQMGTGNPVVIISWVGRIPEIPSLMLSSHMDVVPVFPKKWIYDAFSAHEDDDGNIYARGAQDMKSVAIQYIEAVRRLILEGFEPERSVHLCFTSDEEIGSLGMRDFVETTAFKKLNVGCVLDEGAASPDESFILDYGERTSYNVEITVRETSNKNALFFENTAGESLSFVLSRFIEKRLEEKVKLENNPNLTVGDVTSINITIISGEVNSNTDPPEFKVMFDCRLSLDTEQEVFEEWIEDVCKNAGNKVSAKYVNKQKRIEPTDISDDNQWWVKLRNQFSEMNMKVKPRICPAATDSRYIRPLGISAFNFSPMNHTQLRLHDHNEYLNKCIFLNGIVIYCKVISALARN